mgnify:CR=1 FL=1
MGMYKTHIDIPEGDREKLVGLLNARLADLVDLQTQTKQAHWNVKGRSFIALHELFDEVTNVVREASDTVAERATALGGIARGTARMAADKSVLAEYPASIADGRAHAEAVAKALGITGAHIRKAIGEAAEIGDAATEDVFTEIARELDEKLWFVEAHLQGDD